MHFFHEETMTRLYYCCSLAALLILSACSPSGPSAAPKSTTAAAPPSSIAPSIPQSGDTRVSSPPAPEPPAAALKPEYSDKAAFLAHLEASRPKQAVTLDGQNVWKGFGPAISYRTNGNGSIGH